MPQFAELPFDERPDLSPYLIHLTKNTKMEDKYSAFDNLVSILKTGEIFGSDTRKGFIRGRNRAACFLDVPLSALKYLLNRCNSDPAMPRYEPFGLLVSKSFAYRRGCRPVLYLSQDELNRLNIPRGELWRVVRFEVRGKNWISWLHEREWRCKGDFVLPSNPLAVVVKNSRVAQKLKEQLAADRTEFKAVPQNVLPLSIICQGLIYL